MQITYQKNKKSGGFNFTISSENGQKETDHHNYGSAP